MLRILIFLLLLPFLGACSTVDAQRAAAPQKRIAISFDDVPRSEGAFFTPAERARRLLAGLNAAGVEQAVFFVNPGNLEKPFGAGGEKWISDYVAAGHVLANHTFSHWHLNVTPADQYLADIDRAEAWLKPRPGYRPWFRYPYLDEGGPDKARRDAVRAGIKARGLRNGYVTIEDSDWNTDDLMIRAVREGKKMDMEALKRFYVDGHVEAAEFYDALARRTIGRSPAHMLLLHETDLAALYIADLIAGLRAKGWQIITADEAYTDPLRDSDEPDVPHAQGMLIGLIAWEKGIKEPRSHKTASVRTANARFAEQVLKEKPAQ